MPFLQQTFLAQKPYTLLIEIKSGAYVVYEDTILGKTPLKYVI